MKDFVPVYKPEHEQSHGQRMLDRQLQTFSARVLEHAFNDGIIVSEQVDQLYILLEGLRVTQMHEAERVTGLATVLGIRPQ